MSELDKFAAAQVKAHKRGWELRKTDNPNALKNYTLVRDGGRETDFATIDEVLAALERVKPPR